MTVDLALTALHVPASLDSGEGGCLLIEHKMLYQQPQQHQWSDRTAGCLEPAARLTKRLIEQPVQGVDRTAGSCLDLPPPAHPCVHQPRPNRYSQKGGMSP